MALATPSDLRLGIDVGTTSTEAVVVDRAGTLLIKATASTSDDVAPAIATVLRSALAQLPHDGAPRIKHVMLGTTQATRALVTRQGLRRVAVLRIGGPASHGVPPLPGWPAELRAAVAAGAATVDGGIEADGQEIARFDAEAAREFFASMAGIAEAVAITGVFSSVSPDHELLAAAIAAEVLGDVPISMSHELEGIGLIERENATVLNAALAGVAEAIAGSLDDALRREGIAPARYLARNNGTLMALEHALRRPVLTTGSGPANSIRGAQHLVGVDDAVVAVVGAGSTHVGALVDGRPYESGDAAVVAGVRVATPMPDVISLPFGGGTTVRRDGDGTVLGPEYLGGEIVERALVFGGRTATLTDAAVCVGRAQIGIAPLGRQRRALLESAIARADALLAEAVDRAKVSQAALPLVVVGGSGFLVPDPMPGIGAVIRPEHAEVAGAVGVATAQAAASVDRIVRFGHRGRDAALRDACDAACAQAVSAGADPQLVRAISVEEAPLAYLRDAAVRVRVTAGGPVGGA